VLTSDTLSVPLPPITLHRSETFPAKRRTFTLDKSPRFHFPVLPISDRSHGSCLQITLGNRISQGLSEVTYHAHVDQASAHKYSSFPDNVCLKFAKPRSNRSLAREAWFYEQLAGQNGYEDTITPRCYGFFQVSLDAYAQILGHSMDLLKVTVWQDLHSHHPDEGIDSDSELVRLQSDGLWPLDRVPDDSRNRSA